MRQSRLMSLVKAVTNVVVGLLVAAGTQVVVFPMFGLATTLGQNLAIGAIFTTVSLARSYVLRRGRSKHSEGDCPAAALVESLTPLPPGGAVSMLD